MTDFNTEKLNVLKENLISENAELSKEVTKPMSISAYVDLIKDTLTHFPTHIQIRILARAAMQISDEQQKAINRLSRGR